MDNKKDSNDILVKFSDVTKQYGDLVVLDKLNLEIKKNEMVSIIGPSGSGKTTVLRVLMTLEKINQGIIHLDGEPLTHMMEKEKLVFANEKYLRERRSKIGMVFQQFNLFPHMTALQNCIEAPVEVLGMKKEEAEERALGLLDLVGLSDKKDEHPSRLSGGQQQRVAIARALAIATLCCWPPDNLEGCSSFLSDNPTKSNKSNALSSASSFFMPSTSIGASIQF